MNATDLSAALKTVEQDHQLVLDKVEGLRRAVDCALDPQQGPQFALDRLRDLHRFFSTEFETHLQEEELTLFPLLQKNLQEGKELVARLQHEHEEIRHRLEEFEKSLHVAGELADHPQRMVLRDLLTYGWELWEALDDHARLETQAVQQCLRLSLSDPALTASP